MKKIKKDMNKVTTRDLRRAIKKLKEQSVSLDDYSFILRPADRFLGKEYRGRGRPRNSDYYYKKINWLESSKGNGMVYYEEQQSEKETKDNQPA